MSNKSQHDVAPVPEPQGQATTEGIDDFSLSQPTVTLPPPVKATLPNSEPDAKPDTQPLCVIDCSELVIAHIKERLAHYLENDEALRDFTPMMEWDLAMQGRLSETDILQAYTKATNIPVIEEDELENLKPFPDISQDYLNEWLCLPCSWDSHAVALVVATPYKLSEIAYHWRALFGREASFFLAQRSHIERLLTSIYAGVQEETGALDGLALDGDTSEEMLRDLALEAPIVRLVNDMFARAVELEASDIHVEPDEKQLAIRFRIDGVLQTVMTPPIANYAAIASRLKLIGGLNIAERRLPQDGRTNLNIGRARIDVRVSTVPSMYGESIVLRILRKDKDAFSLDNIGMDARVRDSFCRTISLPYGMILVVGPTGSGKTTTLYCGISLLNSDTKKIITVEDPVEYQISGITQIQVKPAIGLTFASGLRHIVRQDPDIILVGEIRDRETAEIAIHAALTGHLVLSTLHTNDATGAISRLQDMGIENFLISSALVGVLSQRLVRRICPDCQGTGKMSGDQSRSCRRCSGSGYRGRMGIFEYLHVNEEIRQAINDGVDNATLNQIARKNGMRTLQEDGAIKAAQGFTTEQEVASICQLDV